MPSTNFEGERGREGNSSERDSEQMNIKFDMSTPLKRFEQVKI